VARLRQASQRPVSGRALTLLASARIIQRTVAIPAAATQTDSRTRLTMAFRLLTLGAPALLDAGGSPVDLPLGKPFAIHRTSQHEEMRVLSEIIDAIDMVRLTGTPGNLQFVRRNENGV
jgi:hypothetical protein